MSHPSRRERRRAETGERLYRAALRLFAERGFAATTVEDITEAADVGKGTFFNYFPTKEHVLATFGERRVAHIARALEEARAGSAPIRELLGTMIERMVEESGASPALLRSIFAAHACCEPVCEQLRGRMRRGRKILAELIAIGQRRGEIRRDRSPHELARILQLTFGGTMLFWSMDPQGPLEERSAEIWEHLWPGLSAAAQKGGRKCR